jgi:hypothetical protein
VLRLRSADPGQDQDRPQSLPLFGGQRRVFHLCQQAFSTPVQVQRRIAGQDFSRASTASSPCFSSSSAAFCLA